MIEIPRALARTYRAVLRQSLPADTWRGPGPLVLCRSGPVGLILEAHEGELAISYLQAGHLPPATVVLRASALGEFAGTTNEPVVIEFTPDKALARWNDGGVPRTLEVATSGLDSIPPFPDLPAKFEPMPPGFLSALGEAAKISAPEKTRYSLTRVQLRGKLGEIVATDGKQLLIHKGFSFPWAENLLVPPVPAFAGRVFVEVEPVEVGQTKTHVAIRAGNWTFLLAIDVEGSFPEVAKVVPRVGGGASRLCLDPADVEQLLHVLPRLPGDKSDGLPVTLDLGSPVAVRARGAEGSPATEMVLPRSTVSGPPTQVVCDRRYLHRALQLGFTELVTPGSEQPVLCRDPRRLYLWMPLSSAGAVPASADVARVTPPAVNGSTDTNPQPQTERTEPMADRSADTSPPTRNGSSPGVPSLDELLAEAEALRGLLQESQSRLARLGSGLKLLKRQGKALQAAVDSLKHLQQLTP